jgi:hypothetical protein
MVCLQWSIFILTHKCSRINARIGCNLILKEQANNFYEIVQGWGDIDIGQVSAYRRKLYELPLGTSKGLLHFVQYKGSTKVIRY